MATKKRISEDELLHMYWDNKMSMPQIADEVGVCYSTIRYWMNKYEIELRTHSESLLTKTHVLSEEELKKMYLNDNMSMRDIAELVGVCPGTVCNRMKKYGIDSRTLSESSLTKTCMLSKESLEYMYYDQRMSTNEIAKSIGVYPGTVHVWMRKYGIELRTYSKALIGKYTGENSWMWQGGISFEPYCEKFNNKFKEAVRERDDYICQLCGYEQKLSGQKLSIHHIHYDKENCYPDVVALCRSCHAKTTGNREQWEEYFESQLLNRGLLNWNMERQ